MFEVVAVTGTTRRTLSTQKTQELAEVQAGYAAASGRYDFVEVRDAAPVSTELETCGRCGGSGIYVWGTILNGVPQNSGVCFRCQGAGKVHPMTNERGEKGRGDYGAKLIIEDLRDDEPVVVIDDEPVVEPVVEDDDAKLYGLALPVGTYTLEFQDGDWFTFRVKIATFGTDEKTIVEYLAGPDNSTDFVGFGFMKDDGTVALWKKFRGGELVRRADQITLLAGSAADRDRAGLAYALRSSRCRRCNRILTVPTSIHNGYGPDCIGKV